MISATPDIPAPVPSSPNTSIKPATPDIVQFNDSEIPIEFITDLLFENVGGQEIISISRNDIVNGQKVLYTPIKNISQVNTKYNPQNLFAITDTSSSYFNNYSINLQEKVPEIGTNENLGQVKEIVFIDDTNGNLVVNVVNMRTGEEVEILVMDSLEQVSDIIY
jgi:hypothetical protein